MTSKILLFIFMTVSFSAAASIYCPTDRDVWCSDNLDNLDLTGIPTLLGTDAWYTPKHIDTSYLSDCREGIVERTWFVDYNNDDVVSPHEPVCKQILTVLKQHFDTFLEFPEDITVSCLDDIIEVPPTILTGPCEHVGYEIIVEEVTFVEDACLKIHHNYEVINWCHYDPSNPDPDSYWTHTRVIKVMDNTPPQFAECNDETFDVEGDCAALVELTMSAEDMGGCPSGELKWYATVDLWADGTDDLPYGPNESGIYKLDAAPNGETVSILFPERYGASKHKVKWVVSDGCHNFATCSQEITIEDNKKPTPYCRNFLTFAFDGSHGALEIPVEVFAIDGFDNCTRSEDLRFSFSSNIDDKVKTIECGEEGFKFYRIYVTDEAGNQDFCEVFALVADNGSCDGTFRPEGSITMLDNSTPDMPEMKIYDGPDMISAMSSDTYGDYLFEDMPIMETYTAKVDNQVGQSELVDLVDLVILQRHLLGLENLEGYALKAADLDKDGKVKLSDLYTMRDHIIGDGAWQSDLIYAPVYEQESSKVSHEIALADYQSGFDFFAFHRGNVSDLLESREPESIKFETQIVDGNLLLTNNTKLTLSGQYVKPDVVTDWGGVLETYPDGKVFEAGELHIILEGYTDMDEIDFTQLAKQIDLVSAGSNFKSDIKFVQNEDDDSENAEESLLTVQQYRRVYPNPSHGNFTVLGRDVKDIKCYSISGQELPIAIHRGSGMVDLMIETDITGPILLRYNEGNTTHHECLILLPNQ